MFFCFFFYNIIKVNHFLDCFIILLHLISWFSLTKSLFVLYAWVSIESIDCILLSSFELKAIVLISSVKILCFSLLNLCCVFKIISLFFYEFFMIFFFSNCLFQFYFSLNNLFYYQGKLLLNSFWNYLNLTFLFMIHFFCVFAFFFLESLKE